MVHYFLVLAVDEYYPDDLQQRWPNAEALMALMAMRPAAASMDQLTRGATYEVFIIGECVTKYFFGLCPKQQTKHTYPPQGLRIMTFLMKKIYDVPYLGITVLVCL